MRDGRARGHSRSGLKLKVVMNGAKLWERRRGSQFGGSYDLSPHQSDFYVLTLLLSRGISKGHIVQFIRALLHVMFKVYTWQPRMGVY